MFFFHTSRPAFELRLLTVLVLLLAAAGSSGAETVDSGGGDLVAEAVARHALSVAPIEGQNSGAAQIPQDKRAEYLAENTPKVEIVLIDGDVIHGRLVREEKSQIILMHRTLGKLEILKDSVKSWRMENAYATVVLADGETIEGEFVEQNDWVLVLKDPNLGRVAIPRDRIDSIKIEAHDFEKEKKIRFYQKYVRWIAAQTARAREKGWRTALDLSVDSTSGGTVEESVRFGAKIRRTLPDRRMLLDMSYYFKRSSHETTDDKSTVGLARDWLYPESKWFWFLLGRFDNDRFESWEQRANAQIGPGYHIIKTDDLMLDGRLGVGPRREWGSLQDEVEPEGLVGLDFDWDVTENHTLTVKPYFFPVVGDINNHRFRLSGEWRFRFEEEQRWSFLAGTLYEYTSIIDPGQEHNDFRVYLGWHFAF